jgi:O-antigen/teichoic acid export membrane protein
VPPSPLNDAPNANVPDMTSEQVILDGAGVNRRIFGGVSANVFGQVVSALIQILPVPVLIYVWGIELYGVWLMLSVLPAFLVLSDMGLSTVAGNAMMMFMARGDLNAVRAISQNTWLWVTGVSVTAFLISLSALTFVPWDGWVDLTGVLAPGAADNAAFWLMLYSVAIVQGSLILQVYRCGGNYGRGVIVDNIIRIAEYTGVVFAALLGAGIGGAAFVFFLVRAVGTMLKWLDVYRISPWWRWDRRLVNPSCVKALWTPGLTFLLFPLSNSVIIQGATLLVGVVLGPAQVVVFSVMRTMTRITVQACGVIRHGVWPEMSRAFGLGDVRLARAIHRWAVKVSMMLGLAVSALLVACGPWVYEFLTHGKIAWDWTLFALLQLVALTSCVWYTSMVAQLAKNEHQGVAITNLAASLTGIVIAFIAGQKWSLYGVVGGLLVYETVMAFIVPLLAFRLLGENWRAFLGGGISIRPQPESTR